MQNPKIKLYHQHIVTQRVLNKYQILLRSHQIYNPSHIHSFLQETVGDHLNILRIRKVKGFLLVVLLYYMETWYSDISPLYKTRDLIPLYILKITLYILPLISFPSNLCQRPFLQTVSKAFAKSINAQYNFFFLLFPRSPKEEGVYCFTSVRLSVRPSFRLSKIFFVAFFSVIVDGRNLIFGHKRHIGTSYCGKRFGPIRFLLPVCRFCWFLYTFNIHLYMHIFRRIFLSNYWWLMTGIWYLVTSFI